MSPNLSLIRDAKKFMWDGCLYSTQEEATCAAEAYRKDNFEVEQAEEEGKFLIYTRRVVKEVAVAVQ